MIASVQLLAFRIESRSYGLRLSQVQRVIRSVDVTPVPEAPDCILGIIDVHGEILPVLNFRKRIGIAERELGLDDQFIIARTSARTVAIVVDEVIGIVEHPADDIFSAATILPQIHQIDGVIPLDDGLMLVHDLDRFLSMKDEASLEQALTEQQRHGC